MVTTSGKTLLLILLTIAQIFGAVQVRTSDLSQSKEKTHCCGKACACETSCGCIGEKDPVAPLPDQSTAIQLNLYETFAADYVPSVVDVHLFPDDLFTVVLPASIPSPFSALPPPEFHLPLRI